MFFLASIGPVALVGFTQAVRSHRAPCAMFAICFLGMVLGSGVSNDCPTYALARTEVFAAQYGKTGRR